MSYLGQEKIETDSGNRPKVSRIHIAYMIDVILFLLFRFYVTNVTMDAQIRDIIFMAITVIGIVLMVAVALTNRKMANKSFVWNNWIIVTILFVFNCLRYVLHFLN